MRFRSLDALRGVCAVAIVLRHSAFTTGNINTFSALVTLPLVDFFFVLSGFVIAHAYQQRILDGLSFRRYLVTRLGRLYPLHLFMLLVWVPYVLALAYAHHELGLGSPEPLRKNTPFSFLTNLLLIHSLGLHDSLTWNFPAWAVGVQFWTYIAFFATVALLGRRLDGYVSALVSLTCYATLYSVTDGSLLRMYDLGILRTLGGFFAGVAIHALYRRARPRLPAAAWTALEVAALAACIVALTRSADGQRPWQLACFVAYMPLVFVMAVQHTGLVSRLLAARPLQGLGRLSYSIYLTHAIFTAASFKVYRYLLRLPVAELNMPDGQIVPRAVTPYAPAVNLGLVLVVVAVSYLTHRYIEEPWRRRSRAW